MQQGIIPSEVRAEGYEPKVEQVTLQAGIQNDYSVALEPSPGKVTLSVTEPTFAVLVNGVSQGQVTELSLVAGSYDIEIRAPGKTPQTYKLEVVAGQTTSQAVTLASPATPEPMTTPTPTPAANAKLTIKGEPDGADVYINGAYQGSLIGGSLTVSLPAGDATLLVSKDGFDDFEEKVTLSGQDVEVSVLLTAIAQAATPEQSTTPQQPEPASTPATPEPTESTETAAAAPALPSADAILSAKLGTFNDQGKTDLIGIFTILDQAIPSMDLTVIGPSGWNGGQALNIAATKDSNFQRFKGIAASAGSYQISDTARRGATTINLGTQSFTPVQGIVATGNSSSALWDVEITWNELSGAKKYIISVERVRTGGRTSEIKAESTSKNKIRLSSLSLNNSDDYVACVVAMNWDVAQPLPVEGGWQPMVSRMCMDVTLQEDITIDSSDPVKPPPTCTDCGCPGEPPCP